MYLELEARIYEQNHHRKEERTRARESCAHKPKKKGMKRLTS